MSAATPFEPPGADVHVSMYATGLKLSPALPNQFHDLNIVLSSGRITCIAGDNGSGKTVLSYILARFAPHLCLHQLAGDIHYGGATCSRGDAERLWGELSYTFQDPDSQYSELRVIDELNRTIPEQCHLSEVVARYELGSFLHRSFASLSYGERQRALWARDMTLRRHVYFLDEVGSYLDEKWQQVLSADLRQLSAEDRIVCLFGHPNGALAEVVDNHMHLSGGTLIPGRMPDAPHVRSEAHLPAAGSEVIKIRSFDCRIRGRRVVCPCDCTVRQSEIVAVEGDNGAGKTTLMMAIMGLLGRRPNAIQIADGCDVAMVMQNPYSQTLELTVSAVQRRVQGLSVPSGLAWVNQVDGARDPLSLSYGEQKVFHVLDAVASEAKVVLIDELTTGLSSHTLASLAEVLLAYVGRGGAVVLSCHPGAAMPIPISRRISLCEA